MSVVKTVKIVSSDSKKGYMVINKSDFTNRHELFKDQPKAKKAEKNEK